MCELSGSCTGARSPEKGKRLGKRITLRREGKGGRVAELVAARLCSNRSEFGISMLNNFSLERQLFKLMTDKKY
jgi:hypothetical protein